MTIRQVSWDEVKDKVAKINPDLHEMMSSCTTHPEAKLYLATYKFGDLIVENGLNQLPINDQLIPINHPNLPEPFKTDLAYSNIIAGMFLNKTAEVFIDFESRVHPIIILQPGDFYGLWELFDPKNSPYSQRIWHIAAGARTLFLIPKVMDHTSHHRMQRLLHLDDSYLPQNIYLQGKLFKSISNAPYFQNNWQCEVLFLSRGWFEKLPQKQWQEFHYACLKDQWQKSNHLRNQMSFEMVWHLLSESQNEARIKANVYVFESVKHLINIAMGAFLGFRPLSHQDDLLAPISIIEQAYLKAYKLKNYIPTILGPTHLSPETKDPIYYSFMLPTLLALNSEHNFRNTLEDERNIKTLLEGLQKILETQPEVLHHFTKNIEFNFFHYEADPLHGIKPSKSMPEYDPRLNISNDKQREFCENGPFVRACVMINNKK